MADNKTYGYIKKRIFDLLCENTCGECLCDDINREYINSLMPDTLNGCVVRMYCSLPIGKTTFCAETVQSEIQGFVKIELPSDFERLTAINERQTDGAKVSDGFLYIPQTETASLNTVLVTYKKRPFSVDENTSDDYAFDMSALSIEALCILAAAELCRPEESSLYTRLVCKYSDLAQGIYNAEGEVGKVRKNSFFAARGRGCF